jgi:hypothetical protein
MEELNKASETLNKFNDEKEMVVYLQPATVVSLHCVTAFL